MKVTFVPATNETILTGRNDGDDDDGNNDGDDNDNDDDGNNVDDGDQRPSVQMISGSRFQ